MAKIATIILAAGKGTRMHSALPKVLHKIAHRPMIQHVINAAEKLAPDNIVVVIGPDMPQLADAVQPLPTVVQPHQRGTGDAVKAARSVLGDFKGDILVLYGDVPLVTSETLFQMIKSKRENPAAAIVVLGMQVADSSAAYGRLLRDDDGYLAEIVEYKDASPDVRAISLCNSGIMLVQSDILWPLLDQLRDNNSKGEFYLTDIVALARQQGKLATIVDVPHDEVSGVNSRAELAHAEMLLQQRLRLAAMQQGVTMHAPETIFLSADTKLGRDVTIWPNVVFGSNVVVDDGVEIFSFSHLESCRVDKGVRIGPFARLRPGTHIHEQAHIGNFVEVKNSDVRAGAKINHLSYVGDAVVGVRANIGAGTITCNYDGYDKFRTQIGDGAFIGSNTALVAPVAIGDGAIIGAGSVITRDVAPDALAISRAEERHIAGHAAEIRARKQARSKKQSA